MATVDSLEIEIKAKANSATKSLENLRNTLTNLRSACQNGAGLKEVASALERINKASGSSLGGLKAYSDATKEIASATAQTVETANDSDSALVKLQSTLTSLDTSIGKITDEIDKTKSPLSKLNTHVEESNKHFKKFNSQLGHIALYRAFRAILKTITDSFKEGVDAVYDYSVANNYVFKNVMDNFKSTATVLKNQIGSFASEVLTLLMPAIIQIINLTTKLFDYISQIFAVLNGKSKYLKAVQDISVAWKDSTKAAKEYKSQTLGIDELNIISKDDGGNGSGSAGGGQRMFDDVDVTIGQGLQEVLAKIKEHLDDIYFLAIEIGAAFATWKLASLLGVDFSTFIGALTTIAGLATLIYFTLDAWNNGLDFKNLTGMLVGIGVLALGLTILFGTVGLALAFIVGGIALVVVGFREFIKTGELTNATLAAICIGILLVGAALGLIVSPIALVVAAVLAAVIFIAAKADEIKAKIDELFDNAYGAIENFKEKIRSYIGSNTIIDSVLDKVQAGLIFLRALLKAQVSIIKGIFDGIVTFIKGVFSGDFELALKGLGKIFQSIVNGLIDIAEGAINAIIHMINAIGWDVPDWIPLIGGSSWHPSIPEVTIPWRMSAFANGGFPETGQLFLANEAGAEMVGSIGNRTAVANSDQIIAGIESGVASAVSAVLAPYLSQIENNTRTTANKDFSVNIGDREIAKANNRGQRMLGKSLVIS